MKYQIHPMIRTTYVDGANPAFIKSLKLQLVEETGYDTVIARYILEGLVDSSSQDIRMDLPPKYYTVQISSFICSKWMDVWPYDFSVSKNSARIIVSQRAR